MYERFYGFHERPFSLLPDPDYLYLGEKHRTALDLLELAVFNQSGFCVISGEIGAGKTTLIRELLNRLDENVRVGLVSNTHRSFGELMQWIMAAYGLPCGTGDRLALHKRFIDFVIQNYASKQTTLLIIDEAQNLSVSAMEELRMLSNVNSDKDLVLQVILVGQQQLRDKLGRPALEQFAQRIGIDFHLTGLDEEETRQYIQHRVKHAGVSRQLFSDAACRTVYRFSHGIPRVINRICDLSLVYGYAGGAPQITPELVKAVVEDQQMSRVLEAARKGPAVDGLPDPAEVVQASMDALSDAAAVVPDDTAYGRVLAAEASPSPAADGEHAPGLVEDGPDAARAGAPRQDGPAVPDDAEQAEAKPASVDRRAAERGDDRAPRHVASSSDSHAPDKVASELHALVVHAEKNRRRPETASRGGFWLWTGFLLIAGATVWSSRDAWYPLADEHLARLLAPVLQGTPMAGVLTADGRAELDAAPEPRAGDVEPPQVQIATVGPAPQTAQETVPETAAVPESEMAALAEPQDAAANAAPAEAAAEPEPTAAQREREAEQRKREAEQLAREAEQREREAEQREREAELRREQERLAKVREESKRLERERFAAERKLAEQRKARVALEQKMRREQEKLRATQIDARRMTEQQRAGAQAGSSGSATPVAQPAGGTAETEVKGFFLVPAGGEVNAPKPSGSAAPAPPATGTPPGRTDAKAAGTAVAAPAPPAEEPQPAAQTTATAEERENFLANPCNGPTARFMSTCF